MLCLCIKHIHPVDSHTNSAFCFVTLNLSKIANMKVCDWSFARLWAKPIISVWFVISIMDNVAFTCNHRMDWPLWSWHSLTQRKKEKGERKAVWWKDWTQPPLALFPSLFFFLPCGVNLAKRRQHPPIYTSSSSSFFCSGLLLCSPCLYFHPHPPLSSLCVGLFAHVCVHVVCVLLHAMGGVIISCTVMWFNPWGWKHQFHTGCAAKVSWHRYCHLPSPVLIPPAYCAVYCFSPLPQIFFISIMSSFW